DEEQPVCQRCARAGRYCDRNHAIQFRHHSLTDEHTSNSPLNLDPKDALREAEVARFFHHYVSNLASWYDLSDSVRHFSRHVPYEALSQPLLFNALIAFAAIHLSRTKVPSLQARAERHHARCVQLLIDLSSEQVKALGGTALAALNMATLQLARIVNAAFGGWLTAENCHAFESRLEKWHDSLPAHFRPYHDSVEGSGSVFPTVRLLAECHASVAHYYLVAKSIVAMHQAEEASAQANLHCWAVRLCGIAFGYDTPAVIVNWFGPVSYCGRYLQSELLQTDLVRKLQSYKRETGWPVQRFVEDLKRHWAGDSR
ncbi:hypothetical protein D0869_10757, partial [Hortaea werneckii]